MNKVKRELAFSVFKLILIFFLVLSSYVRSVGNINQLTHTISFIRRIHFP